LCEQSGILTGLSPEMLTLLSDYAITARYPGEEPTLEEAQKAVAIVKTVHKFAHKWLGMK
jgi:hypothetical protein